MRMKKPAWQSMPVLNVQNLSQAQLGTLQATYDLVSKVAFRPLAQLESDPTRIQIDKALYETLTLPSLAPIRELLAREPGLTGRGHPQDRGQSKASLGDWLQLDRDLVSNTI